jgi:hypothetical protein
MKQSNVSKMPLFETFLTGVCQAKDNQNYETITLNSWNNVLAM